MKINHFTASPSAASARPKERSEHSDPVPQDSFQAHQQDPEPPTGRPNFAEAGALYGGLAGTGVAVALGCMTFGVGLMVGMATVPMGIALGTGIGAMADLLQGRSN